MFSLQVHIFSCKDLSNLNETQTRARGTPCWKHCIYHVPWIHLAWTNLSPSLTHTLICFCLSLPPSAIFSLPSPSCLCVMSGQSTTSGVSLCYLVFEEEFHCFPLWGLARLSGGDTVPSYNLPVVALGLQMFTTVFSFYVRAGNLSSGPSTSMVSALATESSPQCPCCSFLPLFLFLLYFLISGLSSSW